MHDPEKRHPPLDRKHRFPLTGNQAMEIFFGASLAVQEFDEYGDLISLRWQGEEMPVWIAPEPKR